MWLEIELIVRRSYNPIESNEMWRIQAQGLYVRIWTKLYAAFTHHFNYLHFGFQFRQFQHANQIKIPD